MPLEVILAAGAVGLSLPLLWYSLAGDRRGGGRRGSRSPITDARTLILQEGAATRLAMPALRAIGTGLRNLTPLGWIDSLRRNLRLAGRGDGYAVERTLVLKFALAGAAVFIAMFLLTQFTGPQRLLIAIVLGVVGFFAPDAVAASQARERQTEIQLELPDTIDQITMSVEAGLGLEAAMTRAAAAGDGPLADELHRTLREIQLGVPRDVALRNLSDRTHVADVDSLVLAVVQSDHYGIPVAKVLRVQAAELRDKRRQRAEERALKIPVLLIFPLAFCIFPAMFIVLLGPAVIRISRDLGPNL